MELLLGFCTPLVNWIREVLVNAINSFILGYAYDPDCMYINGSGRDYYEFYIQLNRCGTLGKNSLHEDSRKNPTVSFISLMDFRYATFLF